MAAKLTRLTHKMAIQLHVVVENCTICSSRSMWPVRGSFRYTLVSNILNCYSSWTRYTRILKGQLHSSALRGDQNFIIFWTVSYSFDVGVCHRKG
jgi:hypothetical protein